MTSDPTSGPSNFGSKVAEMVHDSPALRRRRQSSFSWKPLPVAEMLLSVIGWVETLVSMTWNGSEGVPRSCVPKSNVGLWFGDGVNFTADPVPCRVATSGLPGACAGTVSVPETAPTTVGVKLTEMLHILCGWATLAQSFVWEKLELVWISPIGIGVLATLIKVIRTEEDVPSA